MHKLFWLFLVGDHAFLEFLELAALASTKSAKNMKDLLYLILCNVTIFPLFLGLFEAVLLLKFQITQKDVI